MSTDGSDDRVLPVFPAGLVAILATIGDDGPSAIPVSAVRRAGDRRVTLALAHHRRSLARLRAQPRVALTLLGSGFALCARGTARVVHDELPGAPFVAAVLFEATRIEDAGGLGTVVHQGVRWGWRDAASARRHEQVIAALDALGLD